MPQKSYKVLEGNVLPVGRRVAKKGEIFSADSDNPGIRVLLEGKRIEEVDPSEAGPGAGPPETIGDLSPRECKSLIVGQTDQDVLKGWLKDERRPSVKKFLADRLKALKG